MRARTFFAAAFFCLLDAVQARAASCTLQTSLPAVSDAMMQCLEQIQSSGYDLPNADPATKTKLAQAIADGVRVLDEQEKWLNQQKTSPDPGDVLKNNKLQITDIRDLTKDEVAQAAQIVSRNSGADSKNTPSDPAAAPSGRPGGSSGDAGGASPGAAPGDTGAGDGAGAGSGGAGGGSGGGVGGRQGPLAQAHASVGADGAKALGAAAGVGAEINSENRAPESLGGAGGGPQGKGMGDLKGSAGAGKGAGADLANPKNANDLMLASMTGFRASADQVGLKVAGGRLVGPDGKPASPSDLARLQAQIQSDPTALMKRPDFFNVVSREQRSDLIRDFNGRPEIRDTDFKHIGLTEGDRDFQRTTSCQKLSGDCNPHTTLLSYKKGDNVVPEDLRAISLALHEGGEESAAKDAAPAKLGNQKGLYSQINGVIRGFREFLQGDSSGAKAAAEPGAVAADGSRVNDFAQHLKSIFRRRRAAAADRKPSVEDQPVMASTVETQSGSRKGTAAVALVLAAVGVGTLLRRRATPEQPPD